MCRHLDGLHGYSTTSSGVALSTKACEVPAASPAFAVALTSTQQLVIHRRRGADDNMAAGENFRLPANHSKLKSSANDAVLAGVSHLLVSQLNSARCESGAHMHACKVLLALPSSPGVQR